MAPRNRRLEQAKPKGDSPAKAAKREESSSKKYQTKGFGSKDLPRGKITQNRAKPGMTSPQ
jgi:hypothetical protein